MVGWLLGGRGKTVQQIEDVARRQKMLCEPQEESGAKINIAAISAFMAISNVNCMA